MGFYASAQICGCLKLALHISIGLRALGRDSTRLHAIIRDYTRSSAIECVFTRQPLCGSFCNIDCRFGANQAGQIDFEGFARFWARIYASVRDYARLYAIERD